MKITGFNIHVVSLPLFEPFIIAYERWDSMPAVLLHVMTDTGLEGWGEAVPDPMVSGETLASCVAMLEKDFCPALLGTDPRELDLIHQKMAFVTGTPAAKAAIDIAFHDILGKEKGIPVWRLLGDSLGNLEVPAVISVGSPQEQAASAKKWQDAGVNQFKVKLNGDEDVQRIKLIRETLGSEAKIRVDVNQGWKDVKTAALMLKELREFNLDYVEQPLPWWDLEGMAELRKLQLIPIMVDEGVLDIHQLRRVINLGAADYLNIKLMKCGGLHPGVALANMARKAGMETIIGSMVETAIGSLAGAHLAKSIGAKSNEMVGPRMYSHSIGDFQYSEGKVVLADEPGLGFTPYPGAIQKISQSSVAVG